MMFYEKELSALRKSKRYRTREVVDTRLWILLQMIILDSHVKSLTTTNSLKYSAT
ncbi:MAG: hypothetical protein Q9M40_04790 [Sulfurimonas sp.]|nr:hypothetical protein [Sulfurimonas sp.]